MGENDAQFWLYLDPEGQQQGPVTADDLQALALQGTIHPETEVWTEGLEQWVPATHIEGLLPEHAPEPHHPQLLTGGAVPQAAAHPIEPAYPTPTSHPNPIAAQAGVPPESSPAEEGHYPATPTKRASFAKILGCLLGGVVLIIAGPMVVPLLNVADPGSGEAPAMAAVALLLITNICGLLLMTLGGIFALLTLHRAWNLLRWGTPRTTPGKAVGFLFIPLFNLYWIFVAHYGLAKDWNRIMASYPDLLSGPRLSAGTALGACICLVSGIAAPVGMILLAVHYAQICRGINFMAEHAMHETRAGGIQLY